MDYYTTMLFILIALAIVMLFLLLHLKLFRTAFAFGLALLFLFSSLCRIIPGKSPLSRMCRKSRGHPERAEQADNRSAMGPGRPETKERNRKPWM